MRVALLTASVRPGDAIGGQVAEKLAFFVDSGADTRVITESADGAANAVSPHCLTADPRTLDGPAWEFVSSADLVVAEFGHWYPLLGWLPALAGGKARVVIDYHGVTPAPLWGAHHAEAVERAAARRGIVWSADAVVVHSRFTRAEMLDPTGFPAERCHTLPHGVDVERFAPGRPGCDLRDRLGFGACRIALFVGRMAPNKRAPLVVDALDRLRDLSPPVHAVFVGDTTDVYAREAARTRQRAAELGLQERVHLLGTVGEDALPDLYRSAAVLVLPSVHEGFGLPVLEAMASAVPVVAARAGALPETLGSAGLTFLADDVDDLARQLRRVLDQTAARPPRTTCAPDRLRVAVVAGRYGPDALGGAETSLRTVAEALHAAGHAVEVYATCAAGDDPWTNTLPEGSDTVAGIAVHRFPVDPVDVEAYSDAVRRLDGPLCSGRADAEAALWKNLPRSMRLLQALGEWADEFDAIIAGPYLSGLTADVATRFPDKVLVVPCFHDEPAARLRAWPKVCGMVAGLLFHSPEEQDFAQVELGISSPGAVCMGTFLDPSLAGNPEIGRHLVGGERPYLLFAGRHSAEKALPTLLDYARRYSDDQPGRFTFAFLGRGPVRVPDGPWARDLGFVAEDVKRHVFAGASAIVQLSRNESLSLACLEGWRQGVPAIVSGRCAALTGHLARCQAGRAVDSYETFAAVLDDLHRDPGRWRSLGKRGRDYVRSRYGSLGEFTEHLIQAVRAIHVPLAERMRRRGFERARSFARLAWRERFGRLIEDILHSPPRDHAERLQVEPRVASRTVAQGEDTALVAVRVTNAGTHALVPDGPGRTVLRAALLAAGEPLVSEAALPGLLMPGQRAVTAIALRVPREPGVYPVAWSAARSGLPGGASSPCGPPTRLVVEPARIADEPGRFCEPILEAAQQTLIEAHRLQRLPDDYEDVSGGRLRTLKRWVKRKLLGNFKRAYVDVLSRQQSAFNTRVLAALAELTECCATVNAAARVAGERRPAAPPGGLADAFEKLAAEGKADDLLAVVRALTEELAEARARAAALEGRLSRLDGAPADAPQGEGSA